MANAQGRTCVGADLSHEPDKPSIAVVTASMQPDGIAHEEQIRIQALVEPSPTAPPDTPARRQEIIVDLEDMVFVSLEARATLAPIADEPR